MGRRIRSNNGERECTTQLEQDGWEIHTRGWPDILAVKGNQVRFIEVKPHGRKQMSPAQRKVQAILAKVGIKVELYIASCKGVTRRRDL